MGKGKRKKSAAAKAAQRRAQENESKPAVAAAQDAAQAVNEPEVEAHAAAKDEKYHKSSGKSMWDKTDRGDLIISDDPLKKQQDAAGKKAQKADTKRQKRRIEKLRQKYGLQKMTEFKEPRPISAMAHVWALVLSVSLSAIWVFAFNALYDNILEPSSFVPLALLFFFSLFSMLVIRGLVESRRRYDVKPSKDTIHFYLQMLHYDAKWWFLITFGIYVTMWFVEHFLPVSGTIMDVIYLAGAAYLGYIWTVKYKGRESVPFTYMETIFCFTAMLSNYIMFFLIR